MSIQPPELIDPSSVFLAQGPERFLTDNLPSQVDPQDVEHHHHLKAAVAIAGAFLAWRAFMAHRVKVELPYPPPEPNTALRTIWNHWAPVWLKIAAPAVKEAYVGLAMSEADKEAAAADYAASLGDYVHQTSADALVTGYESSLRRGITPSQAWLHLTEAYGLDTPAMLRWSNVLGAENPAMTGLNTRSLDRALLLRADLLGQAEAWHARQVGKSVLWMAQARAGELPFDAQREWVTAHDERTCPVCRPMDKVRVGLEDRFELPNGSKIWAPGVHPNCRCDVRLVLPDKGHIGEFIVEKRIRRHTRESFAAKYGPGEYKVAPRHLLALRDGQERKPSRIEAMTEEVKAHGIQKPLGVSRFDGKAYLMDGHHRLAAARKLKLRKVPVKVNDGPYLMQKNAPGDPYDRDRRGRFAPVEERQPRLKPVRPKAQTAPAPLVDAAVEQMLRDAQELQVEQEAPSLLLPTDKASSSLLVPADRGPSLVPETPSLVPTDRPSLLTAGPSLLTPGPSLVPGRRRTSSLSIIDLRGMGGGGSNIPPDAPPDKPTPNWDGDLVYAPVDWFLRGDVLYELGPQTGDLYTQSDVLARTMVDFDRWAEIAGRSRHHPPGSDHFTGMMARLGEGMIGDQVIDKVSDSYNTSLTDEQYQLVQQYYDRLNELHGNFETDVWSNLSSMDSEDLRDILVEAGDYASARGEVPDTYGVKRWLGSDSMRELIEDAVLHPDVSNRNKDIYDSYMLAMTHNFGEDPELEAIKDNLDETEPDGWFFSAPQVFSFKNNDAHVEWRGNLPDIHGKYRVVAVKRHSTIPMAYYTEFEHAPLPKNPRMPYWDEIVLELQDDDE